MIMGIIDKLVFGIVLIALFQLPLFADHYRQYLSGFEAGLRQEVNTLDVLAQSTGYPSTQSLIDAHRQSTIASVRMDADNKQILLHKHQQALEAIRIFNEGSLFEKTRYIFTPERASTFKEVSKNFKPGIPLNIEYLLLSALFALIFNIAASSPYHCYCYLKRRTTKKHLA